MNLRRQHKLSSLGVCFFLVMFCVSGIMLNHTDALADCEVSRAVLPPFYRYKDWNGGLLRGTTAISDDRIAIYGRNGIWLTDSAGRSFADYNAGIPEAAHHRNVRALVKTGDGTLFAVATTGLYRRDARRGEERWNTVEIARRGGEAFSDATVRGDTLVVVGRSAVYVAVRPWREFEKIILAAPDGGERRGLSAFRAVWLFHSGQLFGLPGILVADAVAVILIFLCVTGLMITLLPRRIRRRGPTPRLVTTLRRTLSWHNRTGLYTIALTLTICVTGWCLRPPVLIALATAKTKLERGEDAGNPWHDRLRMVRYDETGGCWLLSTSEGFYALTSLRARPQRLESQPPVSVMGLNVFESGEECACCEWLVGSFSGMFVWNCATGDVRDYFTGEAVSPKPGPPFGRTAVSGYSADFGRRREACIVTFDRGCIAGAPPAQPEALETLPMSLANVALEVHTGRIYFGNAATWFFVFIAGGAAAWSLVTGLLLAIRKRRGREAKDK